MSVRRHWLLIVALLALVLTPLAATPQAAAQEEDLPGVNVFFVDNLDDAPDAPGTFCNDDLINNNCSLRQAITAANASSAPGEKQILFDLIIPGLPTGAFGEIVLTSRLPAITADRVSIVGPAVPAPRIAINGNGRDVGLIIERTADQTLIVGLSLYGFTTSSTEPYLGAGIYIEGTNSRIEGNYIGVNPNGQVPAIGANFSGVTIRSATATGNVIGSSSATSVPNVIAGNISNGVLISNASGNTVINNQIGVIGSGPSAQRVGNGGYGIQIASFAGGSSQNNIVGGNLVNTANVIAASGQAGIFLRGPGTTGNLIRTNLIGVDRPSSNPATNLGNVGDGIVVEEGASNNTIGGASSALIVSNNDRHGIVIRSGPGGPATNNRILGPAYIGTNQAGTAPLGNQDGGVLIDNGAVNTVIQGSTTNLRIGGNTGYGVHVRGTATGTLVNTALIGVAPLSGTTINEIPNTAGGVLIEDATGTTIRNSVVSGNAAFGIQLDGATNSTIQTSFIGLDVNRTATLGNNGPGISILNSRNTLVGGPNGRNYIAGNLGANGHGVTISGSDTLSVTVEGNTLGLARNANLGSGPGAYVVPAGNGGDGLQVTGGGDVRVSANTIAASAAAAITVSGIPEDEPPLSGTEPLTVSLRLNEIGYLNTASPTVFTNVGNAQGMVLTDVRAFEVISNSVRYSGGPNLRLTDALTGTVRGNLFNNSAAEGVLVNGDSFNITLRNNTLRSNTAQAVRLAENALRIRLDANRMAANGGAVLLEGTTIYSGTGDDPAQNNPGPNHDIDPPFNLRIFQDGTIQGQVITRTNTTPLNRESDLVPISACAAPCTIQAFGADATLPAPDGQGWDVLSFESGATIFADGEGNFTGRLAEGVPGQLLVAATDAFGNSSAFAVFTATYGLELTAIDPAPPVASAAPTESVDYRLRLRNTGTVDLSNIRYVTSGTLNGWTAVFNPEPLPILAAGATRDITVTVTLPIGTHPNAAFPTTDRTRVTIDSPGVSGASASLVLETSTEARPVLRVTPLQNPLSFARPGGRVTYQHRITNDGNIPVVVNIDQRTVDPADSGRVWATSVSTGSFLLNPGQTQDLAVNVTVPTNAQVNDGEGNPVRATTLLTATVDGFPEATVTFSDTTGVALNPRAEFFSDQSRNAPAGATLIFFHELENRSNGLATFRFNVSTVFGSEVILSSNTAGVPLNNNTVTLDAPIEGRQSRMQLRVTVRLPLQMRPGDEEVINIFLTDPATGESIDANVENRIIVTGFAPYLYLPMIGGPPPPPAPETPPDDDPAPNQALTTVRAL
jgi:hypothetical protein